MKNILVVTSSAQGENSVSTRLADYFVARLQVPAPGVRMARRDLGAEPVPHLIPATIAGIRGRPATPAEHEARALSDRLIDELRAAELIVIASPMYNFGISSTLKAWFDHVLRAGDTFRYTAQGPEGLLKGKKAIVIESRGGRYVDPAIAAFDSQEPHLRTMLAFIGITDISFVRAEGLSLDAATAAAAAEAQLDALATTELPLAA